MRVQVKRALSGRKVARPARKRALRGSLRTRTVWKRAHRVQSRAHPASARALLRRKRALLTQKRARPSWMRMENGVSNEGKSNSLVDAADFNIETVQTIGTAKWEAARLINAAMRAAIETLRSVVETRISLAVGFAPRTGSWSEPCKRQHRVPRHRYAVAVVRWRPRIDVHKRSTVSEYANRGTRQAVRIAKEYLESGKHADWAGFRPLFVRKRREGKELPPHKDWVRNVYLPRIEKALSHAENVLERLDHKL